MRRLRTAGRRASVGLCALVIGCVAATLPASASAIGFDDHGDDLSAGFGTFGDWQRMSITYGFLNGTDQIPGDEEHQAVRQAMGLWTAAVPGLKLVEVPGPQADMQIQWNPWIEGLLGEATFPKQGDIIFNTRYTWTTEDRGSIGGAPYDLVTIAAHEVGHALGLTHSSDPNALMRNGFAGSQRYLAADDIAGINHLFPRNGSWSLRNTSGYGSYDVRFRYAGPGATVLTGDWDGDGDDTPGVYDPASGMWMLRNSNSAGYAEVYVQYGAGGAGLKPVVGDWDGDGDDTLGLYNPADGQWMLRNSNTPGYAEIYLQFSGGDPSAFLPVAGDWNGDGFDTPGVYNPSNRWWFLRNSNSTGYADDYFQYGTGPGSLPVTGDWNGDGIDTVGVFNPNDSFWHLRHNGIFGEAVFPYGGGGPTLPIAGDWNNDGIDTVGTFY